MNVLVTGASGFIGRHCVEALSRTDAMVHCVSRREPDDQTDDRVRWHSFDLLSREPVEGLIERIRPTHLLHLAWCVTPGTYLEDEENFDWVAASLDLVRAFRASGGSRVVCTGTCAEYDWSTGAYGEDDAQAEPRNPYAASKAGLRSLLSVMDGLSVVWPRLFFVFGPGEHPDKLVSSAIAAFRSGRSPALGDPGAVRDFVYVKDVATALAGLIYDTTCGPVNVSSGVGTPVGRLVGKVGEILGISVALEDADASPTSSCVGPNTLIREATGWAPRYTLEAALEEMIALTTEPE